MGPLDGVRVVGVTSWMVVPAAGADPQRRLKNLATLSDNGPHPFFEIPDRGKRGVVLDRASDGGSEAEVAEHRRGGWFE
jgi:hypothetical protein